MSAGHRASKRLIRWTQLDQTGPLAATSFAFGSPSSTSNDLPNDSSETASGELRSVVEQRFRGMNEAHDRIRTEMLCTNHDSKD